MEEATLNISGHEVGLRSIGENKYEPKNKSIIRAILEKNYTHPQLEKLNNTTSSSRHIRNKYPEVLINMLLRDMRPLIESDGRPVHKIKSFSFVCTAEVVREASILIKSLRMFHDQPIYITCDEESKTYLKEEEFGNLDFDLTANKEDLAKIKDEFFKNKFKELNTFHKAECIYKKMGCMERAIKKYENTLFLDADIIVIDSLQEDFTRDLALSPHYHPPWKSHMSAYCGIFNAGYVFCCDEKFPQLWRDLYLNDSSFYEQECMNYFCEYYSIDIFPESHNVGFWRDESPSVKYKLDINFPKDGPRKPKSFHVHILNEMDFKNNYVVKEKNAEMSKLVMNYLYKNGHKELYDYIKTKKTYTRKTAFIHFGKCAGVYVNKYMRHNVLQEATELNSWSEFNPLKQQLHRDWTEEELVGIAKDQLFQDTNPIRLAHNHHINWTEKAVTEFKNNNWFTFTFIRNPKDLICSLYFYAKKCAENMGLEENPLAGAIFKLSHQIDPSQICLQDFFFFCLTDKGTRRLWTLPSWIDQLDYVAEFNDKNFKYFLKKYYSHNYIPEDRVNTSQNKGFDYYLKMGEISPEVEEKMENDPEYKRYLRYLDQV